MGAASEGWMKDDAHVTIPGAPWDFEAGSVEYEAAVFLKPAREVKPENKIELNFDGEIPQVAAAFLDRSFPPLIRRLLGFSMNMTLIEISDFLVKDFVGGG